jgi:ubiquitin-protein ligase
MTGEEARKQVDIAPTDTVGELYQKVAEALNKSPRDFRLTYNEKPLTDKEQKIATLGMKEGDTVYASVVAEGGGLKDAIKRMMGFPSSPSFFEYQVYPVEFELRQRSLEKASFGESMQDRTTLRSEVEWLNREYAGMLRHQPAAKAIDLRHYYFEFKATAGDFEGLVFRLHMFVNSPYDPPLVYCENPHGHPNFYPDGRLCIRTTWTPFGSLWSFLDGVKFVINQPNYHSPAR